MTNIHFINSKPIFIARSHPPLIKSISDRSQRVKPSSRDRVTEVAERVARIEVREQRQNILGCAGILAGLRFEERLISQIFREEVMKESVTYQAILREGRQQGIERELALIMRQLNRRVGVVSPQIQQRLKNLSVVQLEDLGEALLDFNAESDLVSWLDEQIQF